MPLTLPYTILDVFAGRALEGNPLAVFHDGSALDTAQMQAIARETNLSETTFIIRSGPDACAAGDDAVRVRIFTTQEELPFAGHPTLGTATWLWLHDERVGGRETITLAVKAGRIPVQFDADSTAQRVNGTMRQNDPVFQKPLDAQETASALGLGPGDLLEGHAPQIVSTGVPFCIVPLLSLDVLSRLAIPQQTAAPWLRARGASFAYCIAPVSGETQWRARMQFYGGEDPATGSAAGCAIAYLVQQELVRSDTTVYLEQGIEIQRPSSLRVAATLVEHHVRNVRVGGSTIPVASGTFCLP